MRMSLGGYEHNRMSKQVIVAASCVLVACARPAAMPTQPELCSRPEPAPTSWPLVRLPGSAATLRLPRSYVRQGMAWHGPRGGYIAITSRPHQSRECLGGGVCTRPSCSHELAERTVSFDLVAAWPEPNRPRSYIDAAWEEVAGTDVVLTAAAMDAAEQREQLRIVHSLDR